MPHQPYEFINGATLPGEFGIVTSRVYNWLKYAETETLEPVSCWVLAPKKESPFNPQAPAIIANLIVKLGEKLQENAGVDIVLDDVVDLLKQFPPSKNRIMITGEKPKTSFENIKYICVADSMRLYSNESKKKFPNCVSIIESWRIAIYTLYAENTNFLFDLSNIRETDDVSTGKQSFIDIMCRIVNLVETPNLINFLQVCSELCAVIKRGGFRRNGAVTCSLKYDSPEIIDYMSIPFGELSHVKKSVHWDIQNTGRKNKAALRSDVVKLFVEKYNKGELFAEKYLGHSKGTELRSNVCRGIGLIPGDKCLISNINYGMIRQKEDIPKLVQAYSEVAEFLCQVFELQIEKGYYFVDRQIAICPVGLANCLRNLGISYREFIDELTLFNDSKTVVTNNETTAAQLVFWIHKAMKSAMHISMEHNMRACLSVEPNESCSRRYKDAQGYDLAPNIVAPDVVPGIGVERRHSEIGIYDFDGSTIQPVFNYGKDIETASQLTPQQQYHLNNQWQILMNNVGMAHMISYEHWGDFTISDFYAWLYDSALLTLYYKRDIGVKHLEKGNNNLPGSRNIDLSSLKEKSDQLRNKLESKTTTVCTPDYCESCED